MKERLYYQYYVEGEDEKKFLEVLKRDLQCIASGKVEKFNVIQNKLTITRIRPLRQGTIVAFVYDTDVENIEIIQQNIEFLKAQSGIKDVLCIPQVKNLEEEILRACKIRNMGELTHSCTKKDYKRDLISCGNLGSRLEKCGFDISKFWNSIPENKFYVFGNDGAKIKI